MAGRRIKKLLDAALGTLAVGLLTALKRMDRRRTANFAGAVMRKIGPLFKEHRVGRDNLRAAFPDKSDAEVKQILAGVWDNLGRIGVEFTHLDEFHIEGIGPPRPGVVSISQQSRDRYDRIRQRGRAIIGFAGHLANWEIPGLAAELLDLDSAVLYRRPNIRAIRDLVIKLRAPLMGELVPTGFNAPLRLARLLQSGVHVGILVDQHYGKGVEVNFFGRRCMANPLTAQLARQTECPIHGIRVVRSPDGNSFLGEITDEIEPVRDADGRIDIQGTMQAITAVVEGWVREHPEQWLWLHRRWR